MPPTQSQSALEMLDQAGIGRDPDALRGAVERLAEEVKGLREQVANRDAWLTATEMRNA